MAEDINGGVLVRISIEQHNCPIPDIIPNNINVPDEWTCGVCKSQWTCKFNNIDPSILEWDCVVRRLISI